MEIIISITEREKATLANIAQEKDVPIHTLCQMYVSRCAHIYDSFMSICDDDDRFSLRETLRKNR